MSIGPTWKHEKEPITAKAQDVLRNLVLKTYSEPNVFVRELAQNAAGKGATELHIALTVAQNDPTRVVWLTVQDNGTGMERADIRTFLSCLGAGDNTLGQFGVGFFSTLATSDYVEVYSRKADSQAVRAAYWRDYGDEGEAIIDHAVGDTDERAKPCGTEVRIKFPFYGKLTQQQVQTEVENAVERWCKYLDMQIFLGAKQLPSAVNLPCRAKIAFRDQVTYKDPVTNAEETCSISGALGISNKNDVKFLKDSLVIQQRNLQFGGSWVPNIEGFVNCGAFEITPARDSIIANNGQRSGAIYNAVMERANLLVEKLFEEGIALPDWSSFEESFVKATVWAYFKNKGNVGLTPAQAITHGVTNLIGNPELMKRVVWLKTLAGPGSLGNPALGKEVTIAEIWKVLQGGKRIFFAVRLDQIVEDLAKDGNVVVSSGDRSELLNALVGHAKPGESIQSAEGQEAPDHFKTITTLSAEQVVFLEICRMLYPAVVLAEPKVPHDPRTIWIQGYYRRDASEEIGINVVNPFVAGAIAQCSTDPIMAGIKIFHTIIHERNHKNFQAHNDDFLRGLEQLLDDEIGPWLTQLRLKTAPKNEVNHQTPGNVR